MSPENRQHTGLLPPCDLQKSFTNAICKCDASTVRSMLEHQPDVAAADANHYTALMHAAATGDLSIVRLLLPLCIAHEEAAWLVQQAFEVAVEAENPKTARFLIDIGADPDWEFVGMAGGWERCPVCLSRCSPSSQRVCAHWICTSDAMGFTWFVSEPDNFDVEVEELVSLAFDFFAHPDAESLFLRCPERFRSVLVQIEEHGRFYWALDEHVVVKRQPKSKPGAFSDLHFYGTTPRLGSRIKARAISLSHWIRLHCA